MTAHASPDKIVRMQRLILRGYDLATIGEVLGIGYGTLKGRLRAMRAAGELDGLKCWCGRGLQHRGTCTRRAVRSARLHYLMRILGGRRVRRKPALAPEPFIRPATKAQLMGRR